MDVPRLAADRATARLVLGEGGGLRGAMPQDNPLTLLDIDMKAGGLFTHTGDKDYHAWILAIKGTSRVTWNTGTADLRPGRAIAFADATDISFSSEFGAHVVLFRGRPLRQPFVQRGPYAMGTAEELDAVEAAYRSGRLGTID